MLKCLIHGSWSSSYHCLEDSFWSIPPPLPWSSALIFWDLVLAPTQGLLVMSGEWGCKSHSGLDPECLSLLIITDKPPY